MIPAFPVYLFDVDGTLVDSAPDICGAIQSALQKTSKPDVPVEHLRRYIGFHLYDLLDDLFPGINREAADAWVLDYRTCYLGRGHSLTRVYPGVKEGLAMLGGRKATATTKGTPTTRAVLEQFGLIEHFDHVQGTDGFPAKPAPDVIHKSLEVFGVKPGDCLFVGDSTADIQAGKAAGVRTCAVRYGYGELKALEEYAPDFWIDDLRELSNGRAKSRAGRPLAGPGESQACGS